MHSAFRASEFQATNEREQELKAELSDAKGAIGLAREKASSLEERVQRLNADLTTASEQRNEAQSQLVSYKVLFSSSP